MLRREMLKLTPIAAGLPLLLNSELFLAPVILNAGKSDIEPFQINFSNQKIKDLHNRIDQMNWPNIPFNTGWTAGTSKEVLYELVSYWRKEYDWYKIQKELNKLNHFQINLEGEKLHFVHYKGMRDGQNFPILLLHGWPGSFMEFNKAARLFVEGKGDFANFDLVVPSLPGFVFSDAPQNPGMHVGKVADRMHMLMNALGYKEYGISAGDAGAFIAYRQAYKYPESIKGFHYVFAPNGQLPEEPQDEREREFMTRQAKFNSMELAYYNLQATKPQSLAFALQDSPVGFLAWILEKYWTWVDRGENLWEEISKDDVLTTAMLYWLTGSILSSFRLYYETREMILQGSNTGPLNVPTGYSRFPKEPWSPPKSLVHPDWKVNLIHYSEMPKGGHFPALEEPGLWANEVASFFTKIK